MTIELRRGDDRILTVTVPPVGGVPVDLSTCQQVTFTAKRSLVDDDADAVLRYDLSDGIAVDVDDTAVALITVPAADSDILEAPALFVWDVEIVDVDGLTATVADGYLRLVPDVTREAVIGS